MILSNCLIPRGLIALSVCVFHAFCCLRWLKNASSLACNNFDTYQPILVTRATLCYRGYYVQVECASHSLRTTNGPWWRRGHVMWRIKNLGAGTAVPKVIKFCTQVGYINSNYRMTYHQQKGRGYGHVIVLKFCRLSWCSASRGFVSDSWAICDRYSCALGKGSLWFTADVFLCLEL